ncbi:heparin lyase I family protein [Natrinema versiforme]|uniref:Uncharacterized protein n=1 Tax=Natrinema versiforme TaxID=88724 RepID=A0A4P8WF49_9EURY|nr:heparin lyase I family protein [Natrinema versiforme]QCS41948.1 hypothetical protein FEJ81_06105 [Natrinema versiforme]
MRTRRSYLKGAGALLAGVGVAVGAARFTPTDGRTDQGNATDDDAIEPPEQPADDAAVIDIDYDQHDRPGDVYRIWTGKEGESYSFVDDRVYNGDSAMRCRIGNGENNGSNATYWLPVNGYGQPSEVYQRAVISLGDDWEMEGKDVCRFWCTGLNDEAGPAGSGGNGPPTGDDGWSNLVTVTTRGPDGNGTDEYNLAAYTYHMDQSYSAGELEVIAAPIPSGEWFELETHVRMNSIVDGEAVPNGEVRYWLNGELVYERTDFRWTTTDAQAVEHAGPIVRYGGSENAPTDLRLYYDEHRLVLGDAPPIPSYDEQDGFVSPTVRDEYEGRITFVSRDERTTYTIRCDGEIVHSEWSNIDGQRATYNDTVSITDDGETVVEATIVPSSTDGYFYNGEIVSISADPDPAELWVDGDQVDIDDYAGE